MRHVDGLVNAEERNPDTGSVSCKHDEKDNSGMQYESLGQTDKKIDPNSKIDTLYNTHPTLSSFEIYQIKRRAIKNRIMIFLTIGVLISIISGVILANWDSQGNSKNDTSFHLNNIEEHKTAYDDITSMPVDSEDKAYRADDGDTVIDAENEILDDGFHASMNDDDMNLKDLEYAEDDVTDIVLDKNFINDEGSLDSVHGEKPVDPVESMQLTVNEKPEIDDKHVSVHDDDVNLKDLEYAEDDVTDIVLDENFINDEGSLDSVHGEKLVDPVESIQLTVNEKPEIDDKHVSVAEGQSHNQQSTVEVIIEEIPDKHQRTGNVPMNEQAADEKISSAISELKAKIHNNEKLIQKEIENKSVKPITAHKVEKAAVKNESSLLNATKLFSTTDAHALQKEESLTEETDTPGSDVKNHANNNGNDKPLPKAITSSNEPAMTASIKHKTSGSEIKSIPKGALSSLKEMRINYEEQFNNHTNNWPEYDNNIASAVIAKGEYHIESKIRFGDHYLLHPDGVPIDMDLMINVSIGSVHGSGKSSYGFVIGAKDSNNNYAFLVRRNNTYLIEKMYNGQSTEIKGGNIDNVFIGATSRKSMKIVKRNNKVRFYIDGHLIDEIENFDHFGDKVGFLVRGRTKMSVDRTQTQIRFQSKKGE